MLVVATQSKLGNEFTDVNEFPSNAALHVFYHNRYYSGEFFFKHDVVVEMTAPCTPTDFFPKKGIVCCMIATETQKMLQLATGLFMIPHTRLKTLDFGSRECSTFNYSSKSLSGIGKDVF
jgi:hypothetical protein